MIYLRLLLVPVVLSLCLMLALPCALADENQTEEAAEQYKWFFTLYGGASTDSDFENNLMFNWNFDYDTYIIVGALAREIWRYEDYISFEVEGQLGKYFGQEHQGQVLL